jgi:hypothetical protein
VFVVDPTLQGSLPVAASHHVRLRNPAWVHPLNLERSILVLKPKWRLSRQDVAAASAGHAAGALLPPLTQTVRAPHSAVRHPTALPNAPLHPPRRRCGSGGGGSGGGEGCGGIPPPPVLRFESWRHERGRRVGLALHFHVATSELAVRSDDGLEGG